MGHAAVCIEAACFDFEWAVGRLLAHDGGRRQSVPSSNIEEPIRIFVGEAVEHSDCSVSQARA